MRYFVASWSWWSCFVLAAAALAGALPAWGQTSILVGTLAQRRAEVGPPELPPVDHGSRASRARWAAARSASSALDDPA